MIRHAALTSSVSLAALLIVAAGARAATEKLVTHASKAHGAYLSDDDGHAVYMFTADSRTMSACHDACAKAWPPMMTSGAPIAGPDVKAGLLGTIPRSGGMQVTYAGMPLYYFSGDKMAGATAGEGIRHFGGEWYLVAPSGQKIENEKSAQTGKW